MEGVQDLKACKLRRCINLECVQHQKVYELKRCISLKLCKIGRYASTEGMQTWRVSKPARPNSRRLEPEMEQRGARTKAFTRKPELDRVAHLGFLKDGNLLGTIEGITLIPCGLKNHNTLRPSTSFHVLCRAN